MSVSNAVAVFCASSLSHRETYQNAARSVGSALAKAERTLVYGGSSRGLMGAVSGAVLEAGGRIVGIVPYAMVAAGGEGRDGTESWPLLAALDKDGIGRVEMIIVDSMHERKVGMAQRASAFICLPGGFGTFEEVLEVATWTQIGIHEKPVIILNVLGFFDPLRELIQNSIRDGFIPPENEEIVIFIDGPADQRTHESFDWGEAALQTLGNWRRADSKPRFDWTKRMSGERLNSGLESS